MKKRIISLILVLVMLCFVFASCDKYSIADEKNLASYASLKNKADFETLLKNLAVEDSDFSADEATRTDKAWDSIYSDLASVVTKDGEKLNTGKPSANAVVYYNYYYTYSKTTGEGENAVTTTYYFTDNMASEKSVSVMLGLRDLTDLEKQLKEALTAVEINNYVYSTKTSGKTVENDVVYVSYKCSWETTLEDGTKKPESITLTNERIELKKGNAFAEYLTGKDINTTLDPFEDKATGKKYEGIKINFRALGTELPGSFTEKTYDEKKEVKDIYGTTHDLNGQDLTYHVYPVNYIEVPAFDATSFVNVILDDSITYRAITRVLFGETFEEKSDEEKAALVANYVTKDIDTTTDLTLEQLVEKIKTAQTEYDTALKAKDTAESDYNTKKSAKTAAETAYAAKEKAKNDAAKALEGKTEADSDYADLKAKLDTATSDFEKAKTDLDTATTNLTAAETAFNTAKESFTSKENVRNYYVGSLINVTEAGKTAGKGNNLTDGYYCLTYEYLLDIYNEEIKEKCAKAIYDLFATNVTVNSLPEKAIKETVDVIVDNYKYQYYNEKASDGVSYYTKSKNFKEHLINNVKDEKGNGANGSYDYAMRIIEQEAKGYVTEVVIIYALSEAYGVLVSDKEFKEYMKDDTNKSYADAYGENSVRYALQFDRLMDHLLAYEEVDGKYVYTYLGDPTARVTAKK